jgi:hypothetical protein
VSGSALRQIQCGDVLAAEFTDNEQVHVFSLEMANGDLSFRVDIQPFGDALWISGAVVDPSSKAVLDNFHVKPSIQFDISPISQGSYRIFVSNTFVWQDGKIGYPGSRSYMGGVGAYILSVSCVIKGNKIVAPDPAKLEQGAAAQPTSAPPVSSAAGSTSLDVTKLIKLPLVAGTPMSGAVTAAGSEMYGYMLDNAKASSTLSLSFKRIQGNLNLGLTVLSADGKTQLYQSNLFSAQNTTAEITIPADGSYIVAVYRTDPVPDKAEATAFTVQADIKPQ